MAIDLKNKVAVVTGSTSGIGLGIAQVLESYGCNVVFNGLAPQNEVDALVKSNAEKYGVKTHFIGADMSKPAEIAAMITEAEQKFGSVDILVNNAGIQFTALTEDFPEEKWNQIIAINLSSAFHSIKAALPGMKKRNFGRIINIASAHGLVASAQKVAYVASKHGILGLTKVVALENAELNVTCNAICPGWVLTPLVQKQIEDKAKAQGIAVKDAERQLLGEKEPTKRFSTPDQIGEMAAFLCSPAGSNITGSAYTMDGGWTVQ